MRYTLKLVSTPYKVCLLGDVQAQNAMSHGLKIFRK